MTTKLRTSRVLRHTLRASCLALSLLGAQAGCGGGETDDTADATQGGAGGQDGNAGGQDGNADADADESGTGGAAAIETLSNFVALEGDQLNLILELKDGSIQRTKLSEDYSVVDFSATLDRKKLLVSTGAELLLIELDGIEATKPVVISAELDEGVVISSYGFSKDGKRALYATYTELVDENFYQAYYVDLSGSKPAEPRLVHDELQGIESVGTVAFSPDGLSLFYTLYTGPSEAPYHELYWVNLTADTLTPKMVNPFLPGEDSVQEARFTGDSRNLVFTIKGTDVANVYVADVSNMAPGAVIEPGVQVNATLPTGVYAWLIEQSPVGGSIAYTTADFTETESFKVFVARVEVGGAGSPDEVFAGNEANGNFETAWTPDGALLVRGDFETVGQTELFKVTIDDGVFEKYERLNQTLPASADVASFKIAPDGKHIAYLADADVDEQVELFVVSPTATNRTRLNAEGETVGLYAFGRESDSIAFVVEHEAYSSGLGTSDQAQLLDTIKSTQTFASIAPYSAPDEATFSVLDVGTYAAHVDADARLITTAISYVMRIP